MPGRRHGGEGHRVAAFGSQHRAWSWGELNWPWKTESVPLIGGVWAHSHSYSVFTYLCRDGSRNYRQYWPLNCQGLNSTLSSVVPRRSTRNWSSHKSFSWTGKIQEKLHLNERNMEERLRLEHVEMSHSVTFANRYLHKNIEQTHERRGEVKKLKEELAALQQKLEW